MTAVWLVEADYEQCAVRAVFATEELADAYAAGVEGASVSEFRVFDRPPQPVTYYRVEMLLNTTDDKTALECGYRVEGEHLVSRSQFPCDETYISHSAKERVSEWRRGGPVYIEITGIDGEAVNRMAAERMK